MHKLPECWGGLCCLCPTLVYRTSRATHCSVLCPETVKSWYEFDCYFNLLYEDVVIMYQRLTNIKIFSPMWLWWIIWKCFFYYCTTLLLLEYNFIISYYNNDYCRNVGYPGTQIRLAAVLTPRAPEESSLPFVYHRPKVGQRKGGGRFSGLSGGKRSFLCTALMWHYL